MNNFVHQIHKIAFSEIVVQILVAVAPASQPNACESEKERHCNIDMYILIGSDTFQIDHLKSLSKYIFEMCVGFSPEYYSFTRFCEFQFEIKIM